MTSVFKRKLSAQLNSLVQKTAEIILSCQLLSENFPCDSQSKHKARLPSQKSTPPLEQRKELKCSIFCFSLGGRQYLWAFYLLEHTYHLQRQAKSR